MKALLKAGLVSLTPLSFLLLLGCGGETTKDVAFGLCSESKQPIVHIIFSGKTDSERYKNLASFNNDVFASMTGLDWDKSGTDLRSIAYFLLTEDPSEEEKQTIKEVLLSSSKIEDVRFDFIDVTEPGGECQ